MALLDPEQLEVTLTEIVKRLREALSPVAIYLFGSYAYGTPHAHSDIDVLVVVENSTLDAYSRDAIAIKSLRGIPVSIDVQVYTREEFNRRSSLPVSFERTIRSKGRIVYAA
jgi:uncharacterized protein